jgi:uncharacterized membrane protein
MTTLLKTLSWAFVSGLLIYGSVLWETGNHTASFVAAFMAVALKTPFYTVHEWAWNKLTGHHKFHLPEGTVDDEDEPEPVKERIAA